MWAAANSSFCSARQGLSNEPSLSRIRGEREKLQTIHYDAYGLLAIFLSYYFVEDVAGTVRRGAPNDGLRAKYFTAFPISLHLHHSASPK
ncbi:hypothetical protein Ddc_11248 [Ditylenchus destructor]|nr:hypothetical protein Ddc_11248 [Ditylenchus destructor]